MADASRNQEQEFQDPLENYDPPKYDDPLEQALAEVPVSDIKATPVARIEPDATVEEAVRALSDLDVACLLVVQDERLLGVFSERDVLKQVAHRYDEVKRRPVHEFMTRDPVYVYDSDASASALCVMAVSGYRHVPILDIDEQVVGILSPQRVTACLMEFFD